MMQRNPERLAVSLRCPYTWLAGVMYSAPGGLDTRLNHLALHLQLRIGGNAIFMKQGAILSSPNCDLIMSCHCHWARLCSVTAAHK